MDPALSGAPGSVGQVRECAHRLVRIAKDRAIATVLVGHVTKEGSLAGPRAMEHIVDTVLAFEGDRHHALRMLHALKHRFGTTNELGVFEMTEAGMAEVADPVRACSSRIAEPGCPGSVVTATLEGVRPLLVEVQALVSSTTAPAPRRSARGSGRWPARDDPGGAPSPGRSAGRGLRRVRERGRRPEGARSGRRSRGRARGRERAGRRAGPRRSGRGRRGRTRRRAPPGGQTLRRLGEAARLGFRVAVVPLSTPDVDGIRLLRADRIGDVFDALGLG